MGHNQIGRLPQSGDWPLVLDLLDGTAVDPGELAAP